MKLINEKVVKDIPENLVSIYLAMGWKEYVEKVEYTEHKEKPKFIAKNETKKSNK